MLTFNILLEHLCSCLFFYISDKDKALILCHCLMGYVCEELLFFLILGNKFFLRHLSGEECVFVFAGHVFLHILN